MDGVEVTETGEQRRARAIAGARAAIETLEAKGVRALVFGLLARGEFGRWSDVDIMVTRRPRDLEYALEATVEDHRRDIPFDVAYVDEARTPRSAGILRDVRDVRHLE